MWNQIRGGGINPRSELDQRMRKLTFQHKAGGLRRWDWYKAQGNTGCRLMDGEREMSACAAFTCRRELSIDKKIPEEWFSASSSWLLSPHCVYFLDAPAPDLSSQWQTVPRCRCLPSLYFPGVPTMHSDYLCSLSRAVVPSCVAPPKNITFSWVRLLFNLTLQAHKHTQTRLPRGTLPTRSTLWPSGGPFSCPPCLCELHSFIS